MRAVLLITVIALVVALPCVGQGSTPGSALHLGTVPVLNWPGSITSGDIDWYSMTVPCYGELSIDLDVVGGDLDIYLYDSNLNLLDSSTNPFAINEHVETTGPAGTYYIEIFGYQGATGSFTIDAYFNYRDLIVSGIDPIPTNLNPGQSFNVTADLSNIGNQNLLSPITVYYFVNGSYEGSESLSGGLFAGQTNSETEPVTAPNSPGSHSVTVVIDPNNTYPECNDGNNSLTVNFTIPEPDLEAVSITGPTSAIQGDVVSCVRNIANNGSTLQGTFDYEIRLSTNTFISSSDPLVGYVSGSSNLGAVTVTGITIPSNLTPNTYYWGLRVDPANAISESDEGNNSIASVAQIVVSAPTPPPVPSPSSPCGGTTVANLTPQLSWSSSSGASQYEIEVFDFNLVSSGSTSSTSWNVPAGALSYSSSYGWRVRAFGVGGWSNWSSFCNFNTPAPPIPPNPSGLAPCNVQIMDVSPTLAWNSVPGASGYAVDVFTNALLLGTPVWGISVPDTGSPVVSVNVPSGTLQYGATYWWRVQSCSGGGCSSGASCSFTTVDDPTIGVAEAYDVNPLEAAWLQSGAPPSDPYGAGHSANWNGSTTNPLEYRRTWAVYPGDPVRIAVSATNQDASTVSMELKATIRRVGGPVVSPGTWSSPLSIPWLSTMTAYFGWNAPSNLSSTDDDYEVLVSVRLNGVELEGIGAYQPLFTVVPPSRLPVVTVHGWTSHPGAFEDFEEIIETGAIGNSTGGTVDKYPVRAFRYLTHDGFLFGCTIPGNLPSIQQIGGAFGAFLQGCGYDEVTTVAHSMGGLVVRSYVSGVAQQVGSTSPFPYPSSGPGRVRKYVSLGTPHAGADHSLMTAYFPGVQGCAGSIQFHQLLAGSKLVWDLADAWPTFRDNLGGVGTRRVLTIVGWCGLFLTDDNDQVVRAWSANLRGFETGIPDFYVDLHHGELIEFDSVTNPLGHDCMEAVWDMISAPASGLPPNFMEHPPNDPPPAWTKRHVTVRVTDWQGNYIPLVAVSPVNCSSLPGQIYDADDAGLPNYSYWRNSADPGMCTVDIQTTQQTLSGIDIEGAANTSKFVTEHPPDNTPPVGPFLVSSTTHTVGAWSTDNAITITWSPAQDADSGLAGYAAHFDMSPTAVPSTPNLPAAATTFSDSLSSIPAGSGWYFHITAFDNQGNPGSTIDVGPFLVDSVAPTNPNTVTASNHTPGSWSNDTSFNMSWTMGGDAHSGVQGYHYVAGTSVAIPGVADPFVATTTAPFTATSDGSWWFSVRSKDNAGNLATGPATSTGPFMIDTGDPTSPSVVINGGAASTSTSIVTLTLSCSDGLSGVAEMQFSNDGASWSAWESYATTRAGWDLSNFGGNTNSGTKTVYAKFRDHATNESPLASDTINLIVVPAPTITSLSPDSITACVSPGPISVFGIGFVSGCHVELNGPSNPFPATFISSSHVQFTPGSEFYGTPTPFSVVVVNPAPSGLASNGMSVSVVMPSPTLTSVTPETVYVGPGPVSVTLTGSGFSPCGSVVVEWSGSFGYEAQFASVVAGTVTSGVPLTALQAPGTASVNVVNLDQDGNWHQSSNALTVTICPLANPTPQSFAACVNSPVNFSANAPGATSYLWTFPGGSPATSTLENPSVSWAAPGSVSASLVVDGPTCSQTYYLSGDIGAGPVIFGGPVSQSVCAGEIAIFNVSADDPPAFPPTFIWFKDGVQVGFASNITTYVHPPTTAADHGAQITCDVVDACALVTVGPATLNVASVLGLGSTLPSNPGVGSSWPGIVVRLEDGSGGLVDCSATIEIVQTSGQGTLQGSLSQSAVSGVAMFSGLSYDVADTVTFDIVVSSAPAVIPLTALSVTVQSGPPPIEMLEVARMVPSVPGDRMGFAVSGVIDVNGDTTRDVIVGAPAHDGTGTSQGVAHVHHGGPAADTLPDVILPFGGNGDEAGYSVSGTGDVNGDGTFDYIYGAPGYDVAGVGADAGRAYVIDGVSGAVLFTIDGEAPGDRLGESVAGAGDFDGLGQAEVIVGAPGHDANGSESGRAYVYRWDSTNSVGQLVVTLTGEAADDRFGHSVAGVLDVYGGTSSEVLVGAPGHDAAGLDSGRAYLFEGGATPDSTPELVFDGVAPGDAFGFSVAEATDHDGDGSNDVVIGAPQAGLTGRAYLFSGGLSMDTNPDRIYVGELPGDEFGASVSNANDVVGDSGKDLIIGAPGSTADGPLAGRAYVFEGGMMSDTSPDALIRGVPMTRLGSSVSWVGDFNGDGVGDVIVGGGGDPAATAPEGVARIMTRRGTYPGSGEDFRLRTGNGAAVPSFGPGADVKTFTGGDTLVVTFESPLGTFDGLPPLLAVQLFPTGSPIIGPTGFEEILYINPFPGNSPPFLLVDGTVATGVPTISIAPGGNTFAYIVPAGIGPTSAMLQALAITSTADNGFFATTNAHELVIN